MPFLFLLSTDEDTRSTYIDMWGYEINWHHLEDGWTIERRDRVRSSGRGLKISLGLSLSSHGLIFKPLL